MGWLNINGNWIGRHSGKSWSSYWLTRKPSGLTATIESDTVINLRWTDGADSCDGIKVYISTDNTTFTLKGTANYGDEAFPAMGLTEATLYYFYLVAYTGTHNSDPTNIVNARTIYTPLLWMEAGGGSYAPAGTVVLWGDTMANIAIARSAVGKDPALVADGVNLPTMRFTRASDDAMWSVLTAPLAQPNTVIIKLSLRTINVGAFCVLFDSILTASRQLIGIGATNKFSIYAGTLLESTAPNDTNKNILTSVFNGASSKIRLNSGEVASGDAGANALDNIVVGNDFNYGSGCDADIDEILVYNKTLANYDYVENYLNNRVLGDKRVIGAVSAKLNPSVILYNEITYNFNPATLGYFTRAYYFNGSYYFTPSQTIGTLNNLNGLITKVTAGAFSALQTIIAGTAGDDDGHDLTSVIVDDNGYIYGARQTKDYGQEIKIHKSDNTENITAFTELQKITSDSATIFVGEHSYPGFFKIGTDIFIIYRGEYGGAHGRDFYINKKGLTDSTFAAQVNLLRTGYKGYKIILRSEAEDKAGLAIPGRMITGTTLNYPQLGYIESVDGVNWRNAAQTFSKDISSEYITQAEYEANYLIEAYQAGKHFMATDGFIRNNIPYILVEEGDISTPEVQYQIDYTMLSVRYYSGGWQKAIIPASITGMPYTRNYGQVGRFHLTHDGTDFVLFVLTFDKEIRKYTSSDLVTWSSGEIVTYHYASTLGFYGSPQNRFDKLFVGVVSGLSDVEMFDY